MEKLASRLFKLLACALLLLLSSCYTTKNVPDDDQLFIGLEQIKYKGTKETLYKRHLDATQSELEAALATAPNGALFGSSYYRSPFPYRLWIWNATNNSKSGFKQWLNRKIGTPPVLISNVNPTLHALVAKSVLRNKGYIHGDVNYEIITKKDPKKAKIAYTVTPDTLFLIDSIAYVKYPKDMKELIDSTLWDAQITKGSPFDMSKLDGERQRISQLFRDNGYFFYGPSYSSYLADTFAVANRVQLRLQLADSLPEPVLKKWYIGQMRVKLNRTRGEELTDSISRRHLKVYFHGKRSPIRPNVLLRDVKLRPRQLYSYSNHYESSQNINSAGLFSSTDFQFTPRPGTDTLDVDLTCTFDKPYDFYIEGNLKNRTIGRMGPELRIGITRRNAFRGGEKIDVNLHGSYEWQTSNSSGMNSYTYGGDASIEFPRIIAPFVSTRTVKRTKDGKYKRRSYFYSTPWTKAKAAVDIIKRPGYYKMHIVSGQWSYVWQTSEQIKHEFAPLSVKYQYKNSFTEKFMNIIMEHPYLSVSLDDYFIPKMSYTFTFTNTKDDNFPYRWETTIQESGNITSLGFLMGGKAWGQKRKELFKTPYSQFFKIETNYTKTWQLSSQTQLVAHANAGIIWTFGNSWEYPFSEGFYVGGANSIRAFPARSIGPGNFIDPSSRQVSYIMQHGDSKLVLNLELRQHLFGNLYGALFLDAGNVWSQRGHSMYSKDELAITYENLLEVWNKMFDGTKFRFRNLFKELATGTGIGLRYDLSFLVLRVDWGFGLHVPYNTNKSGYFNIERFKDMHTLHIAIGYPF